MIPQSEFFPSFHQLHSNQRHNRYTLMMGLLLGVLMMWASVATPAQNAQDVRRLEPDQPIERELASGESHAYQVTLDVGQYLEATVAQRGIDVTVTLVGPDGKRVTQVDNDSRGQGQELITQVIETAGSYRLVVGSLRKEVPAGRYIIRLTKPRAATAQERTLQESRRLSDEATVLSRAGKHAEALALAERVLALRQQAFGQEHGEVALALSLLATVYRGKADFAQSETHSQRALAMGQKTMPAGQADLATIYVEIASLYLTRGDFVKAEPLYQRAQEIWEQTIGPDHVNVARVLTNLGNIYGRKGDRLKSEQALKRALEIRERALGAEHPDLVGTLINLGSLYLQDSDNDQAEPYYRRALKIADRGPGQETPLVGSVLNNLGNIYMNKRDFAQAEPLLRRTLAVRERIQGAEHPDVAESVANLAYLLAVQGEYAKAEPEYQRALAMREKLFGPEHPSIPLTLNQMVRDFTAQSNLRQAIAAESRATTVSERNLALNLAAGSERQKLAYLSTLTRENNQTVSLHTRYAPNDTEAKRLSLTTILRRKGRALDAMTDSIASLRRRAAPQDQALLDQLKSTRAQIARLVLNGPQGKPAAEHQSQIKTLEEQREKLEDQISRSSAEFRAQSQPVTLSAVQAAIPARAALVEFTAYRPYNARYTSPDDELEAPRYVAYVLRRQGESQWVELGEKQKIDEAIDKLRRALRDRKRRDYKKLARAVDRLVMQPVRPLLGTTRRVLIAPDGNINLIPFAALVDQNNRFLVERYTFSYLTSGRDLLRLQVRRPSRQSALIVANPDFGEDANKSQASERILRYKSGTQATDGKVTVITQAFFPALPGTAGEAQALKTLLPGATVLTQDQATEALIKQVSSPNVLHVATHGFFLEGEPEPTLGARRAGQVASAASSQRVENPLLRSGLALAGANQHKSGEEDGILTALEAADLDLWGTKLVVLSACQTGIGDVKDGEGVYGLRRALVLAGSESQVMSLWSVSDLATRNLMIEYYQRLQRGEGRTEALRQVQLRFLNRLTRGVVRQGAATDYSHPYYWAGFIQSGEWRSLEGQE